MNLTRKNWLRGWNPAADAINGDPNGLLRMDNLTIDKEGVLGLVDGQKKLATLTGAIDQVFSRTIAGIEYFWIGTSSSVLRYDQAWGVGINMAVPGAGNIGTGGTSCFGDALGNVLAINGAMRSKDSAKPNAAALPLGLLTPIKNQVHGPDGSVNPQQAIAVLPGAYVASVGTQVSPGVLQPDASLGFGVFASASPFDLDTTNLGGTAPAADISQDLIQFPVQVLSGVADSITNISLIFAIGNEDGEAYSITFTDNSLLQSGDLVTFSARRGEFDRSGNNGTIDWTRITAIGIVLTSVDPNINVQFGAISFIGGLSGQLNGVYNYIQVNVNDNGVYQAKSPTSPLAINTGNNSPNFEVINASVTLIPIKNDAQANEYWFFRIAATSEGNNSTLSDWQFVGKSTGANFNDTLSDDEVVQLNADKSLQPNLFLNSLRFDDPNAVLSTIYGIEGLYNERVLYLSFSYIFLSDRLNPDAVDTRFTLKPSGDSSEVNLWIKKLTNNVLILGTTKGLYEISGTLLNAPDGTIDANIISLGEAYPPLGPDVCNWEGGLYYVAADGLRVTTGSNSVNLSAPLRHLFTTQLISSRNPSTNAISRHGLGKISIYSGLTARYSIVAAHQKILFITPMEDQSRRIITYDTVTKTYSLRDNLNPTGLFLSHTGELFVTYLADIYLMDFKSGYGVNDSPMNFLMRTVYDDNGQPRNRKDVFTLKLIMDTGNAFVSVNIQKDGFGVTEFDETSYLNLGIFQANGMKTVYIPLNLPVDPVPNVNLGFRYSLQINDVAGVKTFKLYEATIEYEPRPEQLDYLRIMPTNLGTMARKRWTAYAFVVDTLGNNVVFTPFPDNQGGVTIAIVNTVVKQTFIYYFTSNTEATDMGGVLQCQLPGGCFEFYSVNLEECISEKLPTPAVFLVIPANNYGTPNRKRHTSYKYQILTRNGRVQFTPILDSVSYNTSVVNTQAAKRTVEHFFTQLEGDVIGIDIGGTLQSIENPQIPFEFYGTITPQQVEQLPDRLEYLRIPNNNFGVAAPKRIRTIPIVIDTYGKNVNFTPDVDNTLDPINQTILNSNGKKTLYHYFTHDSFGTDYGGFLQSLEVPPVPFEFYGLGQMENVEVLPVPKKFDQLGPVRFDKIGKIFGFRIRVIMNGTTTSMPYAIYGDQTNLRSEPNPFVPLYSGTFTVNPGIDDVYEIQFPRNVNTDVCRLVLGPTTDSFHRYDVYIKVITSGMESEARWLPIR